MNIKIKLSTIFAFINFASIAVLMYFMSYWVGTLTWKYWVSAALVIIISIASHYEALTKEE